MPPSVVLAFVLSGIAGLTYEVVWSRYLALFVGHSAYAQVLVLAVYLGGIAIGSFLVAERSRRVGRPLLWYAGIEGALAGLGLVFPAAYQLLTVLGYDLLLPLATSPGAAGAVRWGLAGLLLLPQAVLLGTTFPFMAAGLARLDPARSGGAVAWAYLLNTLGGAAGVLLAGFVLVGRLGLPGTSVAAAALNLIAGILVWLAVRGDEASRSLDVELASSPRDGAPARDARAGAPSLAGAQTTGGHQAPDPDRLGTVMLGAAFVTALASFFYEIAWIRMLSLVLGSATHSFELMLSAFVLGLALGAFLIRRSVDRVQDPTALLGGVQVTMGLLAAASLPVYLATFGGMAELVTGLPRTEEGYALFNLGRYGLSLLVMLPATVMAGMTLPLITGILLRAGWGERSIGRVYGANTVGSVTGAALGGLVALPLLGLKGLLLTGAVLDAGLGILLLGGLSSGRRVRKTRVVVASLAVGVVLVGLGLGVSLDRRLLTSAVFRYGYVPPPGEREVLFYRDGRTASISAHLLPEDALVVLSTNGKPDASLGLRWFDEPPESVPPQPISANRDYTTQVLAPLVTLAHRPGGPVRIANIGHGSGLTGTSFLATPAVEELVTVEIEPVMVEGSRVFLPINAPVFEDARSTYVFDDAKAFFSYDRRRWDLIFAEPSNPWVSGIGGLFSREFYARVAEVLAPGGVLGQWLQLYELNDPLFLSVLSALEESFASYRAYLVGDADVIIVARADGPLPDPDWSLMEGPGVRRLTAGAPPFEPPHLEALRLFDEATFDALLDTVQPNTDLRPVLDLGADRARFLGTTAEGIYSFAADRFDLPALRAGRIHPPLPYAVVPSRGLQPMVEWGRAAWLRQAWDSGGAVAPTFYPEWQAPLEHVAAFLSQIRRISGLPDSSWRAWTESFETAEHALHWGTTGWHHEEFYTAVQRFLEQEEAPPEPRAAVELMLGANRFDWSAVAEGADVLLPAAADGDLWLSATVLLDAAVTGYLREGRAGDAARALEVLGPRTGRAEWNARNALLSAWVDRASD